MFGVGRLVDRLRGDGLRAVYAQWLLSRRRKYAAYQVGAWSYGNPTVVHWDKQATLSIGRFCSIADGATILLGGRHDTHSVTTYPFDLMFIAAVPAALSPVDQSVLIGHDVWIGREALIMSGVTIGNGAVIGARAVVARAVEPYAVMVGNPARTAHYRFSPQQIAALQRIAWWDWPMTKIQAAWPLLRSHDIDAFIGCYG